MTDRELVLQLQRLAARLEPDVARELLRAFEELRQRLSEAELARLLRTVTIEQLLTETLDDATLADGFARLTVQLQRTLAVATARGARLVPGPTIVFNVLNPRIVDAIRELDTKVMQTVRADVRETVRQEALAGLEAGENPRAIARRLRATVGLAPNQAAAVRNFRRMLETGDRTALTRALRDKRFDAALRRAFGPKGTGLTPAQIDRMVRAYERRMLAFHAETIARTASIDAMRQGQRLSWEDAIARGIVRRDRLFKRRLTVQDDRVRDEHAAIHGQVRHFDERYSNGELVSGDRSWNCRCRDQMFVRQALVA